MAKGWIEEVPGVNSQGKTREELIENLRDALDEALEMNRADARAAAAPWLERDGLFEALAAEHVGSDARDWPARDQELFDATSTAAAVGRRQDLAERYAGLIERKAFAQFLKRD